MEFKGTKGEIHAVEYAGVIFMQDSEFYEYSEKCNILDYDHVGKTEADANGKLFECALELLQFAIEIAKRYPNSEWISKEANELIKKATDI